MSSRLRYFAYGSNMLTRRLARRVPSARVVAPAWLGGYRLAFRKRGHDGSGKANVEQTGDPADVVHGVLFDLARREQPHLDRVEAGYTPQTVEVRSPSGALPAMTYLADPAHVADGLFPFPWYKAFVVGGAREHRLPAGYVHTLEAVDVVPDPDPDRARQNRRILAEAARSGTPMSRS